MRHEDRLYRMWKEQGIAFVRPFNHSLNRPLRIRRIRWEGVKPWILMVGNRNFNQQPRYVGPDGKLLDHHENIDDDVTWKCYYPERPLWYPNESPFPYRRRAPQPAAVMAAAPVWAQGVAPPPPPMGGWQVHQNVFQPGPYYVGQLHFQPVGVALQAVAHPQAPEGG